jgi:ABC-type transporter Mla subunit MlaD
MEKTAPSLGRILAMVVFTLSCFAIVLFLWVSFGGEVPLRPSPYEARVAFPEATSLAENADVRISGVTIGHVGEKRMTGDGHRTLVTLEVDPAMHRSPPTPARSCGRRPCSERATSSSHPATRRPESSPTARP